MKKFLIGLCVSAMLLMGMTVMASAAVPAEGGTLPAPSSLVQTNATPTSITVKWSAVTGASLYQVEITADGTNYHEVGQTANTSYTINGLASGNRYYVRVLGGNSSDPSGYYKYAYNCVTAPSTAKVVDTTSYPSSQKYSFSMQKEPSIKGYRVKMYNYKTKKTAVQDYTSTYITVAANRNAAYKASITPYTLVNGKKCFASKTLVRYVLQQPQLKAKSHTSSSVTLTWTKMAGATTYSLYLKKPGSSKYTKIATTANNTYKYSGMQANKYYDFYIVANKKVGSKTWKSEALNYYRVWLY